MKKLTLISLLLLLFTADVSFAQDPHFTQFYANPLYLNPAFAGSARCPRFVVNYRNQWPGIPGKTYETYAASYDQHFDAIGGGLGLSVMNDRAGNGKLAQTWVNAMYAYQLNVTRKFTVRAGFQASYIQKSIDPNGLNFGDQIDPRNGFVYPTSEVINGRGKPMFDLSAGVVGYTKNFFVGAAFHHIAPSSTRNEAFIEQSILPTKITAHAGATIPVGGDGETTISPNIIFQQQEKFQTLNLGFYVNKGPFVGGLWYRNEDAIIVLLGINYKIFRFGYSYDVTTSKLGTVSSGSHELSMSWQLYCKPKKKKFRTINCPSF